MDNHKQDRMLHDEEAIDLYQMAIENEQKDIEKLQAYFEFFKDAKKRLVKFRVSTVGDLPRKQLEIVLRKESMLIRKYGPPETPNGQRVVNAIDSTQTKPKHNAR